MVFSSIRTFNFRNLENRETDTRFEEVFLVGENGQGKTNFLEAIYYLCYGSPFRFSSDRPSIRFGEAECAIEGQYAASNEGLSGGFIRVSLSGGMKVIESDGKRLHDRKEMIYRTPCILFCHDDMEFVVGTAERKRQFFDQTLTLYDSSYIDALRRYRKLLVMRNAALKERRVELLDVYDEQLAVAGMEIVQKRQGAVSEFCGVFVPLYREVSGGSARLEIGYLPSWKCDDASGAVAMLLKRRERDLEMGTTTTGPHRDGFSYCLDGGDFAVAASTGQLRLASLALRIGQSLFFSRKAGRSPVLLFDDVLLELDPDRKKRFLDLVPSYDQAFFTFLPGEPWERYATGRTKVYTVSGGVLGG